jgi:AP-1 complex subunit mu
MSVSAVYIMDVKGKIVVSRDYRGDVPLSATEKFSKHLIEDEEVQLTPVLTDNGFTYMWVRHNNLYLMAVTKRNANAMIALNFLYQLIEVFEAYFNELNEESIRDNFVIAYELFDEMMDFGYPQSTEAKILKEYICVQEKHQFVANVPVAVTNAVSWRKENIVHKRNEIFLDVIEKLNLLVASNGTVLRSEIKGVIRMNSFLSGMPELKLGLNDKVLMESHGRNKGQSVEMEDVRFHQCVRLSRFENDRTISFIPPDGEADLLVYRLNTEVRPLIWVEAHVEPHKGSRIEYMIKVKSNFKARSTANNVELEIPVPSDADSPKFKTAMGKVEYVPAKDAIVWKIKQFQGQKEYLMRAHFGLPSITGEESLSKAPISVKFEIPYFTVSGIQVRYLKIIEKSGYHALPWVRYITQNGDYQIRMS